MIKLNQQLALDNTEPQLIAIISSVASACQQISVWVRQGPWAGILGSSEQENVQGETQKRLDIVSNQLFKESLLKCTGVKALASEEEETIVKGNVNGKYIVAFDPLDGSSNIDINGQIGSIFSILKANLNLKNDDEAQFFQPGRQQVCAGYVLYGPATQLVLTSGNKTRVFTLDNLEEDFMLTTEELFIPLVANEFSINMSNQHYWSADMKTYIEELIQGADGPRKKYFNMRWNGAMVGDVHRVLQRGGIFLYPSDNRTPNRKAKLRLLYEASPIALLIESAGGKAMTETEAILDLIPTELHQRVAVILGSASEVDCCLSKIQIGVS